MKAVTSTAGTEAEAEGVAAGLDDSVVVPESLLHAVSARALARKAAVIANGLREILMLIDPS